MCRVMEHADKFAAKVRGCAQEHLDIGVRCEPAVFVMFYIGAHLCGPFLFKEESTRVAAALRENY